MNTLIEASLIEDESGTLSLTLQVEEDGQSEASRVDALIHFLLSARSTMQPAFAEGLPVHFEVTADQTVHHPPWQWSMTNDGVLALNIRHPGLGWIHFRMPNAAQLHQELGNALDVQRTLQSEIQNPPPG